MSEEFDPSTSSVSVISHRSILTIMGILAVGGSLAGLVLASWPFGIGIAFGGLLSVINYLWLDRVTKAVFSGTAASSAGLLAARYILRYFAIGGILLLIYMTDALPLVAVILGLGAFAIAVVIEGLKSIYTSSLG